VSRQASLELEPDPRAAREARDFVASTVAQWGLSDCVGTVQLLTSELVTNGVLHAQTALGVSVTVEDSALTVEVHDNDPRPPIPRSARVDLLADIDRLLDQPGIAAGRGLLLIETLADEWGVAQEKDGKSVWFRLSVA
jgi:anti-sigma regulatory factor (Ser/Thr protein kinase)